MIYRVTTPTDTFTLPIETNTCSVIQVTYTQANVKIVKEYKNGTVPAGMTLDGKNVIVRLTQAETKSFIANEFTNVQVRVLNNNGDAFASKVFKTFIGEVLNEEILING